MIELKEHMTRNSIENEYSKSISLEHRKKFAQFFTPFPIASLMAKWVLRNVHLKTGPTVPECTYPSCGAISCGGAASAAVATEGVLNPVKLRASTPAMSHCNGLVFAVRNFLFI